MKVCPTCGSTAEAQASFCPCCGTSFVVQPIIPPSPPPVAAPPQPAAVTPPPLVEEKKKGGHALPIVIISVLSTLIVTLATLWLSGGLEAMLGRPNATQADPQTEDDSTLPVLLEDLSVVAATYDGGEITTEQYLAYLYLEFENVYYNQGLYRYASPWEQQLPYGEDGEELYLSDYIIRSAQDNIKRQIVLQQMMKEYNIAWFDKDLAEIDKVLSTLSEDAYIHMGFGNDQYSYALKNANLNERSTFYSLYKVGGARAISELELRQYFVQNYLSYKMICIPLTDGNGKALGEDSDAYQWIFQRMATYQSTCEQQGFEAAYALYKSDQSTIHELIAAPGTTDQEEGDEEPNHRNDVDATTIDPMLAQAVRTVNVGDATIVEMASDSTPYIALIQRLNVYDPPELFENSVEDILYTLKYETFDREVEAAMAQLTILFDATVVRLLKPEDFLTILENQ